MRTEQGGIYSFSVPRHQQISVPQTLSYGQTHLWGYLWEGPTGWEYSKQNEVRPHTSIHTDLGWTDTTWGKTARGGTNAYTIQECRTTSEPTAQPQAVPSYRQSHARPAKGSWCTQTEELLCWRFSSPQHSLPCCTLWITTYRAGRGVLTSWKACLSTGPLAVCKISLIANQRLQAWGL